MKEKRKQIKKLLAFTLAEVLITLSILGVVAAITVPSLINHQHRNEVETKLKKMYSTVSAALDQAEANEGKGYASWDNTSDANAFVTKYFLPYLNVQKNCMADGDCPSYTAYRGDEKKVAGDTSTLRLILKDGTYLLNAAKTSNGGSYAGDSRIIFDINGKKGPNAWGKDIFWIIVYSDNKTGSYYFGSSSFWCKRNKVKEGVTNITGCKDVNDGFQGLYCSGWIFDNGLKIPKDYPWL